MIKQQRELFNDITAMIDRRLWRGTGGLNPNDLRILKDVAQRVEWESTDHAESENAKMLFQEIEEYEQQFSEYTPLDKSELQEDLVNDAGEKESDQEFLFCAINDCLGNFQQLISSGEFNYDESTDLFECFSSMVYSYSLPMIMDIDDFMSFYVDSSPLGDEPSDVSF